MNSVTSSCYLHKGGPCSRLGSRGGQARLEAAHKLRLVKVAADEAQAVDTALARSPALAVARRGRPKLQQHVHALEHVPCTRVQRRERSLKLRLMAQRQQLSAEAAAAHCRHPLHLHCLQPHATYPHIANHGRTRARAPRELYRLNFVLCAHICQDSWAHHLALPLRTHLSSEPSMDTIPLERNRSAPFSRSSLVSHASRRSPSRAPSTSIPTDVTVESCWWSSPSPG